MSYPKVKVFVYGTLKKGGSNHSVLGKSSMIGHGRTKPEYDMTDVGGFPGVRRVGRDGGKRISGEVYEVTEKVLANLDILEGEGALYRREYITLDGGEEVFFYRFIGNEKKLKKSNKDVTFDPDTNTQTWNIN